jgi:hypothetical protein
LVCLALSESGAGEINNENARIALGVDDDPGILKFYETLLASKG